jgi:hypothetical protein
MFLRQWWRVKFGDTMEKNENPIKNGKKSNFGILFRRWIDVIFYLFFTFLAYYSYKALETLSDSFLKNDNKSIFMYIRGFMSNGTNRWIYLTIILLTLYTFYFLNRKNKPKNLADLFTNNLKFPSTYIIITIGVFIILLIKFGWNHFCCLFFFLICFHIISSLSLIIFCKANGYIGKTKIRKTEKTNENITIDQISDEEFIKWIKSDDHEDNDYFETEKNYKNQIKTSIKNNGNILLFGDYGIGKSWLLIKIEKELSEEKTLLTFSVL